MGATDGHGVAIGDSAQDDENATSSYVTLVSNDGFEFVVRREAAYVSGTLKRMLDPHSHFVEALSGRCVFDDISGVILEKLCEYLYYNVKNEQVTAPRDMDVPPELCLELLVAADYLEV